jgi:hypothetical protein
MTSGETLAVEAYFPPSWSVNRACQKESAGNQDIVPEKRPARPGGAAPGQILFLARHALAEVSRTGL